MHHLLRSSHTRALAAYGVLAVLFSWPLPLHVTTHLFGATTGDTGSYLWNLWVFSHELVQDHQFPFYTSTIFSLDRQADLSLHNYTVFADVLAIPLLPLVGVVCAYNLVTLAMVVLNGYVMFLLARHLGAGDRESWLAGVLFAFAPCLVARSTEHLSLVMAAPVVVFLLVLHRMDRDITPRAAAAGGAVIAWATFCDPYYGVYCCALAGWHVAFRNLRMRFAADRAATSRAMTVLAGLIVMVGALIAWIITTGGWSGRPLGVRVDIRTLFTPVLALTLLVLVALVVRFRPRIGLQAASNTRQLLHLAPYSALSGGLIMSPLLYALGTRIAGGRYVASHAGWRSSMPGVDVLSFFLPNPNHQLFRGLSEAWLTRLSGGFAENVASVTFVALLVVLAAVCWARFRPPKYWAALALVSASLAVGPFLQIAGVFTYVPTPWTLLRYAPVLGGARAPARFMVVVMIAVAVLFAFALKAIRERLPARARGWLFAAVTFVLLFELLPAPRLLYAAHVPRFYHRIAADRRDVRILELPFGVRDGLSSAGDFNASSLFYQTVHHKRLIGGALSRVSHRRVREIRSRPILSALIDLSEGRELAPGTEQSLRERGPEFVRRARLAYVVVDRTRASRRLIDFAIATLQLEKIATSATRDLYRPRGAPADDDNPPPVFSWRNGRNRTRAGG